MTTKASRWISTAVTFIGFLYFFLSVVGKELLIVDLRLRGGSMGIAAVAAGIFFIGFITNFVRAIKGR